MELGEEITTKYMPVNIVTKVCVLCYWPLACCNHIF